MMMSEIEKYRLSLQDIEMLQNQRIAILEERERALRDFNARIASLGAGKRQNDLLIRMETMFRRQIEKIQVEDRSVRSVKNAKNRLLLMKTINESIEAFLRNNYQPTSLDFAKDVTGMLASYFRRYQDVCAYQDAYGDSTRTTLYTEIIKPIDDGAEIYDVSPKRMRHIAGRTIVTKVYNIVPARFGILRHCGIDRLELKAYWEGQKIIFCQETLMETTSNRKKTIGCFSSGDDIQWVEERLKFRLQRFRGHGIKSIILVANENAVRKMLESAALQIMSGVLL